jgi:diadenosine tetraphosphate (Ap4A) HIT family hydrolase
MAEYPLLPNPHGARVTDFSIDPRLLNDTIILGDLALCTVLLVDDARFSWLILVPRQPGLRDMIDLRPDHRDTVRREIDWVAEGLRKSVPCDKLNIAALGNMVSQLHIHVIARVKSDAAWPKPVWGMGEPMPHSAPQRDALLAQLRSVFGLPDAKFN